MRLVELSYLQRVSLRGSRESELERVSLREETELASEIARVGDSLRERARDRESCGDGFLASEIERELWRWVSSEIEREMER